MALSKCAMWSSSCDKALQAACSCRPPKCLHWTSHHCQWTNEVFLSTRRYWLKREPNLIETASTPCCPSNCCDILEFSQEQSCPKKYRKHMQRRSLVLQMITSKAIVINGLYPKDIHYIYIYIYICGIITYITVYLWNILTNGGDYMDYTYIYIHNYICTLIMSYCVFSTTNPEWGPHILPDRSLDP